MSTHSDLVTEKIKNDSNQDRQISTLPQYTLKEVSQHCDHRSCWIILLDKIYDVTDFIYEHPGGEDFLIENAGRDATIPFKDKGHSQDAWQMLKEFCIGEVVEEERVMHILERRS